MNLNFNIMKKLIKTFLICIFAYSTFAQVANLEITAFVEGSFNGVEMNTTLYDQGVIPINQPFNIAPWNYNGSETLTAMPGIDIVDWVYIELRETGGDASTATPDKFLDDQAAILLSDGSIVQPDGSSLLVYSGTITQNLFVIIYHRNHLPVMSATALDNINSNYTYNFTDALSKAYLNGHKEIESGIWGMYGGDSDGSGTVNSNDIDLNWDNDAGDTGYFGSDLNLDTQVNNPDKNNIWNNNIGMEAQLPQLPWSCGNPISDNDGNTYNTVMIGTQCWMKENLNIGTMIPSSSAQTPNGTIEKYCYNDIISNCDTYGGLYQWDEMMQYSGIEGVQGICPTDWHLPTETEWCTLIQGLDPTVVCNGIGWKGVDGGGKLKEADTTHWTSPNTGATNSSGFTALPGGFRDPDGLFGGYGGAGEFWTSSEYGIPNGRHWALYSGTAQVYRGYNNRNYGFSVRCIRD